MKKLQIQNLGFLTGQLTSKREKKRIVSSEWFPSHILNLGEKY